MNQSEDESAAVASKGASGTPGARDRRRGNRRSRASEMKRPQEKRATSRRKSAGARRQPRVPKALPVSLRIEDPELAGKEIRGISRDMSEAGIFVETENHAQELIPFLQARRYNISVEVHLPEGDVRIQTAAEVVRVITESDQKQKGFGIGLKFVDVSDERKAELSAYLNELIKEDGSIIDLQPLPAQQGEQFVFNKTLYLTDTNALGNAYFSRYFDWQGMAREEFFRRIIPDPKAFFGAGMRILTLSAAIDYKAELGVYDEIEIEVRTANIKRATFELIFFYTNKKTGILVAAGKQRLAFSDPKGRVMAIPPEMKQAGYAYLLDDQKKALIENKSFQ